MSTMRIAARLMAVAFLGAALVGCGTSETTELQPPAPPSFSSSTEQTTSRETTTETVFVTTLPPVSEPEPAAAEAPYIVDCQQGLGPIETYWSDGSVTGYSGYCQGIHDNNLRGEREANTATCDGTICRYPSGATMPDPNATPDDRCTNQINYVNDPRSNAEINSIGAQTGQCPEPIG